MPGNPSPTTKADTTRKELAALSNRVAKLGDKNKLDGDALDKVLNALESGKADLEQNQAKLKDTIEELEMANNKIDLLEESLATFKEATTKLINGLKAKIAELVKGRDDKVAEEAKVEAQAKPPEKKPIGIFEWLFDKVEE